MASAWCDHSSVDAPRGQAGAHAVEQRHGRAARHGGAGGEHVRVHQGALRAARCGRGARPSTVRSGGPPVEGTGTPRVRGSDARGARLDARRRRTGAGGSAREAERRREHAVELEREEVVEGQRAQRVARARRLGRHRARGRRRRLSRASRTTPSSSGTSPRSVRPARARARPHSVAVEALVDGVEHRLRERAEAQDVVGHARVQQQHLTGGLGVLGRATTSGRGRRRTSGQLVEHVGRSPSSGARRCP